MGTLGFHNVKPEEVQFFFFTFCIFTEDIIQLVLIYFRTTVIKLICNESAGNGTLIPYGEIGSKSMHYVSFSSRMTFIIMHRWQGDVII